MVNYRKIIMIMLLFFLFPFRTSFAQKIKTQPGKFLEKGINLLNQSRYKESKASLEKALSYYKKKGDKTGQARAYFQLSRLHLETAQFDKSENNVKKSKSIFNSIKNNEWEFRATLVLIDSIYSRDRKTEAWRMMDKVEKINRKGFSGKTLIDFYLLRGKMLTGRKEYDLALKNFLESLRLAQLKKDTDGEILAYYYTALLYADKKEYKKAREECATGMEIAMMGKRAYMQALMLECDGDIKCKESKYPEATTSYMGSLAIFRSSGNRGEEGFSLLNLAEVQFHLNDFTKSREYIDRAFNVFYNSNNTFGILEACDFYYAILQMNPEKGGEDKLSVKIREVEKSTTNPRHKARAMYMIGKILQFTKKDDALSIGEYKSSQELYRQVGDKKGQIFCLSMQGLAYRNLARYKKAIDCYEEAIEIGKSIGEINKSDDRQFFHFYMPGAIYKKIGDVYFVKGEYNKAIEKYREALKHHKGKIHTQNRVFDYQSLLLAALTSYEVDIAWKALTSALEDIRKLDSVSRRATSYNLIMIALFNVSRGRGIKDFFEMKPKETSSPSILLLEKVHEDPVISKKIRDGYREWIDYCKKEKDLPQEAMAYVFQGLYLASGKKYTSALDSYKKGIELAEKSKATFFIEVGYDLMAFLLLEQGKNEEALRVYKKLYKISQKTGMLDRQVNSLVFIGITEYLLGRHSESLKSFDDAVKISGKLPNKRIMRFVLLYRGYLLYKMKKYRLSLESYQKSLEIMDKYKDMRYRPVVYSNMGKVYSEMGNSGKSLEYYQKAFCILKDMKSLYLIVDCALEYGEILEKERRDEEALGIYLEAIRIFLEVWKGMPADVGRLKIEKGSPTITLFERAVGLLLKMGRHKEALKYLELSRSYDLISGLDLKNISVKDRKTRELMNKIRKLRRKMALIQGDIQNADDKKRRESLSKILASTRKDFFVALNEIKSKNPDFEKLISVRGTDLAALQEIIPEDDLLIEYYPSNDALYIFLVNRDSIQIRKVNVSRERLYEIIRRFRKCLSDPDRAKFTAEFREDRSLLYSLLIEPVRNEIYSKKRLHIIPGGLIWYLPVEILGNEDSHPLIRDRDVSYLSSADVLKLIRQSKTPDSKNAVLIAFGAPSGVDLPASRKEVEKIGANFPKSRIFTGVEATKERFIKEAPEGNIVHIATHSKLNREDINRSYIQFAGKDPDLYLGEVYGIPLKKSTLVTLSSCESALGEDNPGREFASLASAFTAAGASSVVASLWRVEDEATSRLFEEFYRNLRLGKSRAESLRLAKIKLIDDPKTSHPYYWGGFILMGDWR